VKRFAAQDLTSDRSLIIELAYSGGASSRRIGVDLNLYGTEFNYGAQVEREGHVVIVVSQPDLLNWSLFRSHDRADALVMAGATNVAPTVREQVETEWSNRQMTVYRDAEELFLRICGRINGERDPLIEHARMYEEGGCPAPWHCHMVFHKHIAEVARDVARNYVGMQWEIPFRWTMDPHVDVLSLGPTGDSKISSEVERYQRLLKHGTDGIRKEVAFQLGVTREEVQKCCELTSDELAAHLSGENASDCGVVSRIFDDNAVALMAHPLMRIESVYRGIIELVRNQS